MAEDFFVRMRNPDEFKRNLTEGSQSLLNILEIEKRLALTIDERERVIEVLSGNLEEVKKLLNHLELMLPKKEIPRSKVKSLKSTGIAAIEKELADIDSKMAVLKTGSRKQ